VWDFRHFINGNSYAFRLFRLRNWLGKEGKLGGRILIVSIGLKKVGGQREGLNSFVSSC